MRCPTLKELPPPPEGKTGWPWTEESEQLPKTMPDGKLWPKISIVTPSLNQGQFIEETIRSVLLQGYPDLEYIIIDGGSTDNSVEVIKKYERWFKSWISEPDKGHGEALNKGFSHTTGEIMAWLNSDDMYCLCAFAIIAEIFSTFQDVNWLTGCNSWWDEHGQRISTKFIYKNIYAFLLDNYKWIQQESTFWRRSLWERVGGKINERYKFMVDGELWCRFFLLDDLWHIDAVLGGYRTHSSNRAKIYWNEIIREMEIAISDLKRNCPTKIKYKKKLLRCIQKLKRRFKHVDVERIVHKLLRKLYKNINYKKLVFKDGKWVKTTSMFRLSQNT